MGPQELSYLAIGLSWTLALTAIGFAGGIPFGLSIALKNGNPTLGWQI